MPLEKAMINLDGIFTRQMADVALSRVRALAGLQVKSRAALKLKQERGVFDRRTIVIRRFMEECLGSQELAVRCKTDADVTTCIADLPPEASSQLVSREMLHTPKAYQNLLNEPSLKEYMP
jgi:hypothetical protein